MTEYETEMLSVLKDIAFQLTLISSLVTSIETKKHPD